MKLILTYFGLLIFITNVEAQQGVRGEVFWLTGNQMPGPGNSSPVQKGVAREIYVYKSVHVQDVEQLNGFYTKIKSELVAKTSSNASGVFKVKLPPGEYSLFVKEPKGLFGNIFDKDGKINCIVVAPRKYSSMVILVNYEAVY